MGLGWLRAMVGGALVSLHPDPRLPPGSRVPAPGLAALVPCPSLSGPGCVALDALLYRSSESAFTRHSSPEG